MEKAKNKMLITRIVFAIVILLLIIWLVFIDKNMWFDNQISSLFKSAETAFGTSIMNAITFLGNHKFLIPANLLIIAILLYKKRKADALRVTIVALSSLAIMSMLKRLFQRNRPDDSLVHGITNFSFPSGHAFMSITFFGLLIGFIISDWSPGWKKTFSITILLLLILLIGISRIYLRVHYTTDVVAGWLFGILWLLFVLSIIPKTTNKISNSY